MKYISFDTETTGLDNDCQVLTAFFMILDENFNELDKCDLKIKYPFYKIYLKAFQVNQINLYKHEQTAIDSLDACLKLKKFLEKHKTPEKLIPLGHNIKFDIEKLSTPYFTLPHFSIKNYINVDFVLDTMLISSYCKSISLLPKTQRVSLGEMCLFFNIKPSGVLHDAECDIKTTVELFKKLYTFSSYPKTLIDNYNEVLINSDILLSFAEQKISIQIKKSPKKNPYNLRKRTKK